MEKKVVSRADALKKVQEIVKRIETEKAELRKELATTEAELEARKNGTTKSSGFNVQEVLANDNNETVEILKRKIAKLKNALEKPNYADEEFRKYSLIYLYGHLDEHIAERKRCNEELAKLEYEYYILPRKMREIEAERNLNLSEFAKRMCDIGLSNETESIGLHGVEYVLRRYEERCKEYENN